ncbi:MAG: Hpt domain-containing protein [Actinomycetota bacterium]|nr:Hpt domain-containing protein [Actinomycetota bacterium]
MGSEGARRALPDEVTRSLRDAFAAERDARLPHLRAGDDAVLVRHDAHALASSAWVVGERTISTLARAVEQQLEAGAQPGDLAALVVALEGYAP